MKLSISNIGWDASNDAVVYEFMAKYGYSGLEIAPTRIFPIAPYDKTEDAKVWSRNLKNEHGIDISSMQSICYGRTENLFTNRKERNILENYTKKAIDFASAIGCRNLVFGCPRNRNLPEGVESGIAVDFFKELGEYAFENKTVIALEANPPIYHTNYINDTKSAIGLIRQVDSRGFLLNLDIGTMLHNEEKESVLTGNVKYIHHVHVSEPGLKPIQEREFHKMLKRILTNEQYNGYISIEMGKTEDMQAVDNVMKYVKGIFG